MEIKERFLTQCFNLLMREILYNLSTTLIDNNVLRKQFTIKIFIKKTLPDLDLVAYGNQRTIIN